MKTTSLLFAAALFAAPAFAQDECASAVALQAGAPTAFDTTTASISLPEWFCAAGGGPDIWYSYTTTALSDVEVSTCNSATYDTAVEIFSGSCGNLTQLVCNDDATGCAGNSSIATAFGVPSGTNLFIRIGGWNGASGTGTVTLSELAPLDCSAFPDDGFEDNDTCATAVALTPGTFTGLFACVGDRDFYSIAVGANEALDFDVDDTIDEDLELNVYDSSCNLIQAFDAVDGFTLLSNGTARTVIVEVFVNPNDTVVGSTTYDATVALSFDPCSVLVADSLEDNDDCATAAPIGDGLIQGLTVFATDQDYFAVTVANGATLSADIFFTDVDGDLDLYLWDPLVACDTNVATTGGAFLVRGFSTNDNENVTYTNTTGASQSLILEVDVFTGNLCNSYSMMVTGSGGAVPGPIGTNYCQANPNSSGSTGSMSAMGLTSIAANDITLTASSVAVNQFGIFLASDTQAFVPNSGGASNGNLCLGGVIGRYQSANQILNSGSGATFSLPINVNTIPQGGGFTPVSAGVTVNFQAWHRDATGLGSNFTDGVAITLTN